GGSGGTRIGCSSAPPLSASANRLMCFPEASLYDERYFTYCTTSRRCGSERYVKLGIELPGMPRVTVINRSSSVGSAMPGVDLILNSPAPKFLGRGKSQTEAAPAPSPFGP